MSLHHLDNPTSKTPSTTYGTGDLFLDIPMGIVDGVTSINKFGENPVVVDGTREDIWDGGGTYSFPATALITSISQTADQVALRGGTIEIQGLDANWDLVVQDATLDASATTSIVTLTTPLLRIFRMKVLEDVVSSSPIRVHNAGETVDYAVIQSGHNQTLMAIYTVPAGKTAYLVKYYASVTIALNKEPKGVNIKLWVADRENGYEFQLKHSYSVQKGASGIEHDFKPYMKITEKSDIKINALVYNEEGLVSAGFDLIVVDN